MEIFDQLGLRNPEPIELKILHDYVSLRHPDGTTLQNEVLQR